MWVAELLGPPLGPCGSVVTARTRLPPPRICVRGGKLAATDTNLRAWREAGCHRRESASVAGSCLPQTRICVRGKDPPATDTNLRPWREAGCHRRESASVAGSWLPQTRICVRGKDPSATDTNLRPWRGAPQRACHGGRPTGMSRQGEGVVGRRDTGVFGCRGHVTGWRAGGPDVRASLRIPRSQAIWKYAPTPSDPRKVQKP